MMLLFLTLLSFPLYVSSASLPYAEWAHHHMIWISNDRSNQDTVQWMYNNFTHYEIPFGSVLIDSCWASNFNTFIFNSTLFPTAHEMLDRFRSESKHIILWMTSFVNIDSPNYQFAQDHGFLYNKTLKWWHGEGRLLDYYNEEALAWWNSQIKTLIDTVGPIHAFKADESDPYILKIDNRTEAWVKYRTAYYNNTFQILRQLVGPEALIMSRPVDTDLSFSPRDVVFMGWVGDEDGNYTGLKTALRYMLESGARGYVGFGSDIGGFREDRNAGPKGRTKELLLRWTAVGAFSSFMENGGRGEHFPWNFDNETVDIYRSWVNIHNKLIPYLYLHGTQAALQPNASLMTPCNDSQAVSSQSYFLGPNIYVVPVTQDPAPGQTQQVWLPKSSTNQWINFFNTSQVHKSESFISEDTSTLDRIPIYVEKNSLMPMYDIEKSSSLKAYRFVLWGEATIDHQTTTLYTRDGQQWLLRFDRQNRQFSVHFQQQYEASEQVDWIWKFCQYVNGQEICSAHWLQLKDNTSVQLDSLL